MSKYGTATQPDRIQQTNVLLRQLLEDAGSVLLDQDDFQAIVKNMSETNMKFQGLTVQAVRALYDRLDALDGALAELVTQDYNVNYVL